MDSDEITFTKLEKHITRDINDKHENGSLTVVWRDWDKILPIIPKMVYVSSINPGEIKGPHIHKNRTTYFSCIHGNVVLVIQDQKGKFHEIKIDSEKPVLITVPNGIAAAIVNPSTKNNEMINVDFSAYSFKKWKNKS